ncbi:CocE/NonD family hydrolase [Nonomuraea sp. NPDC050153]|uniref:CocE/NonD family hydrolase n=1 Tax=Nonomuraea sp. NPDC050153 TaxID=3364359 RepID=UPI0037B5088C
MSRLLAERGYQVVFQNCRGTFGSTGEFEPSRNEREDGLATLEWLATQPWFSGSVAMFGLSYYGYVQLASGAGAPDHLKALVSQMAASRVYGVLRGEPMRLDGALSRLYTTYNGHLATSLLDKDNRKLEARPDVLTFTGDPVRAATTTMGTVSASLRARSTLGHTDFFARLCEVAPKGTATNLCDGIIRLDQGGTQQVTISLTPTAHCFKRHR